MISVSFVCCHTAPAIHFSAFIKELKLKDKDYNVSIYATGDALKKFNELKISVIGFSNPETLVQEIVKTRSAVHVVLTDMGHPLDVSIHQAFEGLKKESKIVHLGYVENAEQFVPGGYTDVVAKVICHVNGILYANINLLKEGEGLFVDEELSTPMDLYGKPCIGVGYYPLDVAEKIRERRLMKQAPDVEEKIGEERLMTQAETRQKLGFSENRKYLGYFGGNNTVYFDRALPKFFEVLHALSQTEDLSQYTIVFHQHPGAKERNEEQRLIDRYFPQEKATEKSPQFLFSTFDATDLQVAVDAIGYYQTSMGPQFALAGIPVIQFAHQVNRDVLVKNKLCSSVTNVTSCQEVIKNIFEHPPAADPDAQTKVKEGIGYSEKWLDNLENGLKSFLDSPN